MTTPDGNLDINPDDNPRCRVGQSLFRSSLFCSSLFRSSLFRSFQKERQGAIRSFALFKKSKKERFTLSLFSKRAQKSDSLFCSFKKSAKERITLSLFSKRATKSDSLFRSLPKEGPLPPARLLSPDRQYIYGLRHRTL